MLYTVPYQHRTQAIEGFFNILKNRLSYKRGLSFDSLNKNIKIILKGIPKETYYNLIFGAYFKPYRKRKITIKKEKNYKN